MTGRMFTARQVADQLGVAPDTVLRWTRRGELPAVKLPGGAVRYRQQQLEDWLAARTTPGQGVPTHSTTDAALAASPSPSLLGANPPHRTTRRGPTTKE